MQTLSEKTMEGVMWNGMSQFLTQFLQLACNVALARILFPDDFGLLGMSMVFISLVGSVSELGLSPAIIQSKSINKTQLSTIFWINIMVGATLWIITLICSPLVARFFNREILKLVLILASTSFILNPFSMVHKSLIIKNLKFNLLAYVEVINVIVFGLVSLVLAVMGTGVFSILIGRIAADLVSIGVFWKLERFRPIVYFKFGEVKKLVSFGIHFTGANFVGSFASNIDYIIVGKFLGSMSLGYYNLAYSIITLPQRKLSTVITRVSFPAFSMIQDDDERIRRGYLRSIKYISMITFPVIVLLCLSAQEFVSIVYGYKWVSTILIIQILCVAGLLYSLSCTNGSILLAKARPDILLYLKLLRIVALGSFCIIGVKHGLRGVAVSVALYATLFFPVFQFIINRQIDLNFKEYLSALRPAILTSSIMGITILGFKTLETWNGSAPSYLVLILETTVGVASYYLSLRYFAVETYRDLINFYHESIRPAGTRFLSILSVFWYRCVGVVS